MWSDNEQEKTDLAFTLQNLLAFPQMPPCFENFSSRAEKYFTHLFKEKFFFSVLPCHIHCQIIQCIYQVNMCITCNAQVMQFYLSIRSSHNLPVTLLSLCAYHLSAFTSPWIPKKVNCALRHKYRQYLLLLKTASASYMY